MALNNTRSSQIWDWTSVIRVSRAEGPGCPGARSAHAAVTCMCVHSELAGGSAWEVTDPSAAPVSRVLTPPSWDPTPRSSLHNPSAQKPPLLEPVPPHERPARSRPRAGHRGAERQDSRGQPCAPPRLPPHAAPQKAARRRAQERVSGRRHRHTGFRQRGHRQPKERLWVTRRNPHRSLFWGHRQNGPVMNIGNKRCS